MNADGTITIEGSIILPEMSSLQTRGSLAETPGAGLKLTLVEFDLGADADHTFTTNTYDAILKSTSAVQNGELVTFDVTLTATAQPKVLHLFIADDYVKPDYGSVSTVFPSLIVGQTDPEIEAPETEGYWGYVEFPDGYHVTTDADGNTVVDKNKLKEKLTAVPVIRNFAQINVIVDSNVNNFELTGFDLINVPTSGTIAPWNSETKKIPDLLKADKTMKDFEVVAPVYGGTMPGNASIRNQEADAKSWTNLTKATKYMYEHPYEPTRRTYLIVQGIYKTLDDDGNVTGQTSGYYKLDIGKTKADGTYDYYNILRNYRYNVKISEVLAAGMPTVAEAIARAPYNNLIASTETSSMLNVSNGKNMLIVNDTNHIVVNESDTIKVLYRYITDVTGNKNPANNIPTTPGLVPGAVIKQVLPTKTVKDASGAEWLEIDILPNAPGDITATQDFSIVDQEEGLGRTIHLILRKPWQYAPIVVDGTSYSATIARGAENLYQGAPQNISNAAGAELTVYFNLPDGLPDTMFPLEFKLEALKQGIENNKIGDMVVSTGPSLFEEKDGQIVISYLKTVSYNEYIYNYRNDGSNDVNTSSRNTNHTVRCRFTTISAESTVDAEIKIHNDYFDPDASVKFNRVTNP